MPYEATSPGGENQRLARERQAKTAFFTTRAEAVENAVKWLAPIPDDLA
ncbi:hypothetical protein ACNKHW_08110 [Shigella flexneri]